MEQRSEEWYAARAGKFTGSRFDDLMARTKTGVSKLHENLIARVAVERISGHHFERVYRNAYMDRGIELEEEARQAYEAHVGTLTDEIAILLHPDLSYVSCSPDGLVGLEGLVEIKCPSAEGKHIDALLKGGHAKEYEWQLQGQLWISKRRWVDAVSYDPRFPPKLRLAVTRIYPDPQAHAELEAGCISGNEEVEALLSKLKELARE